MSREEAERFVQERDGEVCIRLYRRRDGTVLTSDCPVGRRKRSRRRGAIAAFSGLLVTALFARGSPTLDRAASVLRKLGLELREPEPEFPAMMGVMADPEPANAATGEPHSTGIKQTRTHLSLLDRPGGNVVIGSVPARELVHVKRIEGAWVLLTYVTDDRATTGWTLGSLVQ
jgi:hypothetical protein